MFGAPFLAAGVHLHCRLRLRLRASRDSDHRTKSAWQVRHRITISSSSSNWLLAVYLEDGGACRPVAHSKYLWIDHVFPEPTLCSGEEIRLINAMPAVAPCAAEVCVIRTVCVRP